MLDGAPRFSDGWTLVEDQLRATTDAIGVLFTTSNGYLGLRGRRREPLGGDGLVLVAGVHETRPYAHPEESYGLAEHYQTLVAVTLTLDAAQLQERRDVVGSRSLSAAVDQAVRAHVARLKHLAAVDTWLSELEREHGVIPPDTLEWAAQIVDRWTADQRPKRRPSRRAG